LSSARALQSEKYRPDIFSIDGCTATNKEVNAPFSGFVPTQLTNPKGPSLLATKMVLNKIQKILQNTWQELYPRSRDELER
jgi:hypothetical protein